MNLPPSRVLITDDEKEIRWMLSVLMRDQGYEPLEADDGEAAVRTVRDGRADVMLLDLQMPGMSGLQTLREVRRFDARFPVILVTGSGTSELAKEAGKYGVQGFLTKPFKHDELIFTVQTVLEHRRYQRIESPSVGALDPALPLRQVMGPSAAIEKVVRQVELVAPTDFTVIITGETGAGKEVIAQAIHSRSRRSGGPFIPVDCGSIPETLIESELFGHSKGAFTGAERNRIGCFEAAGGGTLFLDEIGNLPLPMQAKLLRALQERRVYRLGSSTPIPLDVRVLAATNENVLEFADSGKFRRDLYYRLNEFGIVVPPLRERREDILFLVRRFLQLSCDELHKDVLEITAPALDCLLKHTWPGNVRELRNLIRRAVLVAETAIMPEHLNIARAVVPLAQPAEKAHLQAGGESAPAGFKEAIRRSQEEVERSMILQALKQTGGNMKKASIVLQIDYKTIRTKAKEYRLLPLE